MKKYFIHLVFIVMPFLLTAQQSHPMLTREHVLMELFAGTCCPNLPGVEMALEEIIENQDPLVIVRHDYCNCTNGLYENVHAVARFNYYGSTGDPVAYFNGTAQITGGGTNSMYDEYMYYVPSMIGETTAFDLQISLENIAGNQFVAHVTTEKTDPASPVDNLTLHLALTAMEIKNNWSSWDIDIFHGIQVDMFPDHNGTPVDFSTGAVQVFDIPFTIDSSLYDNLYRLVGFLQNNLSGEIVQDFYVDLPLPLYQNNVDLLYVKNIPPGLCNGLISPEVMIQNKGSENVDSVWIRCEANDSLMNSYFWSGSLENYQKEIISIPGFNVGIPSNNKIKIYTTQPNGLPDQNLLNDTIILELDVVDSTEMCLMVVFKTDDKPWETSWELLDHEGLVVCSGDSYTEPYLLHKDTLFITEPGCHRFVLHDSGGDGIETYFLIRSWTDDTWTTIFYAKDFYYTATCHIKVTETAPMVAFTAESINICQGDQLQFFNTTTGTFDSLEWHFESGTPETSNLLNPEIVYPYTGNFDVTLMVWTDFYHDVLTKENYISVFPYPEVQFSEIADQCINWPPLELTQGSPLGGAYSGEFVENGFFYPEQAGTGYHEIQYKYTNEGGCADSATQTVYVDACVGTGDIEAHDVISLFPNPAEGSRDLYITFFESGTTTIDAIFENNTTTLLYQGIVTASTPVRINLKNSNISHGICVLSIRLNRKQFYKKLIVK